MTARFQRSHRRSWSAVSICEVIRPPLTLILALGLMAISASGLAHAQEVGDPVEGKRIAANTCSSCHQIDVHLHDSTSDPIPSFQAIAAMPSTTMLAISVFLRTSHNVMPNIRLTENQITDISAYILSLRDQSPK